MATDFLASGIGNFYLHKQEENEGGYSYYVYLHRLGKVIVRRISSDEGTIDYADGGYNLASAFSNRASLDYKEITKL